MRIYYVEKRRDFVNSFAFWYEKNTANQEGDKEGENTSRTLSTVMNFNLWDGCQWEEGEERFLDIGFKVDNLDLAKTLYFFVPINIDIDKKEQVLIDLGEKFNKTELVDAIFNKSYTTTIVANSKIIQVQDGNEEKFNIYQLDIEHDVELEPFADGTIIKIPTQNIVNSHRTLMSTGVGIDTESYYLRFRIKNVALDFLIQEYKPLVKGLQSAFSATHMIDFRYHNIRSLHKSLIERFSEGENEIVKVTAVHFLFMTKAYVDVQGGPFKSIRQLEKNVWEDYVDKKNVKDLVAYHYVDKVKSDSYLTSSELFMKCKVERSVIPRYIGLTIAFGVLGSVIGSLVFEGLKYIKILLGF